MGMSNTRFMNPASSAGAAIVHQVSCSRWHLLSGFTSWSPQLFGAVCLLPEFPLVLPLFTLICTEQNKYINEKELRLTKHKFTAKGRLDMYNKKALHILSQRHSVCRDYLPGPGFKCGRWMQASSSHEQRCCFREKGVFSFWKRNLPLSRHWQL